MDIAFAIVLLFAIAIGMTTTFKVFNDVAIDLNASTELSNTTRSELDIHRQTIPTTMDRLYLLIFFGAFGAILVSAFLIRSNLLFFLIAVLVLAVFVFISAILSGAYTDFIESEASLNTYATSTFRLTTHLINNYPIYATILGFMVLIALYAKTGSNVGSGI